jgi:hypothetical protein
VCGALLRAVGSDDDTARVVLVDLRQLTPLTGPRNGEYRVVPEADQ